MPVGVCAQAAAIARPRTAVSAIAASTEQHARQRGGGSSPTLCPAMTTSPSGRPGPGQRAELAGDEQAHRDDERLGHRGVLDRLGVAGRAERQEVGVGDRAGPAEEGFGSGEFEPVGEHSGFLRTLSGGEDGQHPFTVPVIIGAWGRRAARKHTADLCEETSKIDALEAGSGPFRWWGPHVPPTRAVSARASGPVQPGERQGDLQRPAAARIGGRQPGQLGGPLQPVPDGVRVHEDRPCAGLQVAPAVEHRAHRLQHLATRGLQGRATFSCSAARASGSPSSARSASRASAATGRGASGQAPAARSPASAAAADSPAWPSPSTTGPVTTGPAPNSSLTRVGDRPQVVVDRPRTTTSWSACTPTSTSLRSDRAARRTAACGSSTPAGVAPTTTTTGVHRRPAEGRRPAGQLLGPLPAHEGVDDQRLQPGVPGAAVLGEARVHVRGGEGDLAAELEDGDVQRLLVAGLGDRGDVVLEHLDGRP